MIITKVIRNTEDGSYDAQLRLTEDQTAFLINFALGVLVQQGTVSVMEIKEDDLAEHDKKQQETQISDFLAQVDPEKLNKA